ncbi:MAG: glycosyl transferase family 28 [Propionivibrio sp.]|nr:glycosyl transferase family 28 [Propionivibrio sp.]
MKVFLTVGSMLPFDRLVKAVDAWARDRPDTHVFAQIGETSLHPAHFEFRSMITPAEYRQQFETCDVVVSHAGMGTVITAFETGRPLVVLPRQPELQEVTSNHQVATAKWLDGRPGIRIVDSVDELGAAICESAGTQGVSRIESGTRSTLISAIREFIAS